jgi:hypothetical protein
MSAVLNAVWFLCGPRGVSSSMSLGELELFLILVLLFFAMTRLLRLHPRRIILIFFFACAIGSLAQLPLGRSLNLYTPNITLYVSYVSVAVVVTWGAALTSLWAIHNWLARILRRPPGLGTYTLCGIPSLIVVEATGSNIINMKLHDYRQYATLMPFLNAMNAPIWLYAYYIIVGLIFFYSSRALGIYCEDWTPGPIHDSQFLSTPDEGNLD